MAWAWLRGMRFDIHLDFIFLWIRKGTNTYFLMLNTHGTWQEQNVNCTEDGWSQLTLSLNTIVCWDTDIAKGWIHGSGQTVWCHIKAKASSLHYLLSISAHLDDTRVWVHALDNSDVTWFSPKWTCDDTNTGSLGKDAFILSLKQDTALNGAYCDQDYGNKRPFICERIL